MHRQRRTAFSERPPLEDVVICWNSAGRKGGLFMAAPSRS